MKKISAVMTIGILLAIANNQAFSQYQIKMKFIEPYHLGITYFKTSNLVFPYAIVSVDRGSKDVLVQRAKGVENILHVKAGKEDLEETNLTVITADGHLYSYILHYTDTPSPLNIQFSSQKLKDPEASFSAGFANEAELKANAERIVSKKRTVRGIKDKKHSMQLSLNGLYIRDNVMYFQIINLTVYYRFFFYAA